MLIIQGNNLFDVNLLHPKTLMRLRPAGLVFYSQNILPGRFTGNKVIFKVGLIIIIIIKRLGTRVLQKTGFPPNF